MRRVHTNTEQVRPHARYAGFTLIEMLVVLAIAGTLLMMFRLYDPGPKGRISLDAGAQALSLLIRQAMTYGFSVVGYGNNFNVGYGVRISTTSGTVPQLYIDANRNSLFDSGETVVASTTYPTDVQLLRFCGDNGGAQTCYQATQSNNRLDIAFARGNLTGVLTVTPASGAAVTYKNVSVYLNSVTHTSLIREVKVSQNGLIDLVGI